MKKAVLMAAVFLLMLVSSASATLTVTVSQFGADSGSVMQGEPFTVTVSGLTGTGSVTLTTLQNSSVFSSSENSTKTYSEGTTTVSWTTIVANQKLSAQTISAVSAVPYSDSGTSSSFDIKLPPSIVTSMTPTSFSNPSGSNTIQMNIQNWGETTAQNVVVTLSLPSGASSGTTMQSISTISGGEGGSGESAGITWTVTFSGVGTSSITITTSPSNADSKTDTIPITVSGSANPESPGSGSPGGWGGGPAEKKDSRRPALVPGVGLRNNLKLQAAIEKVLAKGKLDQDAFQNLIRLSQSISSNISLARSIRAFNGTTTLTSSFTHSGKDKIKGFIIYEKVPKNFSSNAANITVTALGAAGYETVETDPEYAFSYLELSPGQMVNVTYSIKKEVNTSLIDQFQTEVYAEGIEPSAPPGQPSGPTGPSFVRICTPGERRCSGMNLQQCSNAGDDWVTLQTCSIGCEDKSCVGEGPSWGVLIADWGWLVIILTATVIAGTAVALRRREKRKPFTMQVKKKPDLPSASACFPG
jgi:hypothetical protein